MKQKILLVVAILIVVSGAIVLAYPIVSNMIFQKKQQEMIDFYDQQFQQIPDEQINEMLEKCREYNNALMEQHIKLVDPFNAEEDIADHKNYYELLNVYGSGAMGYINIPKINCKLMIYHGTDPESLAKGVGHLEGTSLPIGGIGTHAVLSAHTGTADKMMFTNIDQLEYGDRFYICTLDTILAYQVDDIRVVLPSETNTLGINKNCDYVTLVTCTPYGVNSHRLLVRGVRVDYNVAYDEKTEKPVSTWAKQYMYAIIAGVGIAVFLIGAGVLIYKLRKRVNKDD